MAEHITPTTRTCGVLGCKANDHPTHRFPSKDENRLKSWIAATGNAEFLTVPVKQILNRRICHKHFDNKYRQGIRLSKSAIPTLFLPAELINTDDLHINSANLNIDAPITSSELVTNVLSVDSIPISKLDLESSTRERMEDIIEVFVRENNEDKRIEATSVKELFTEFKPSPHTSSESDEADTTNVTKQRKRKSTDENIQKKRIYTQKYRKEWENQPAYRPWLSESVLGNSYFYCKFCKNNNKCGKTEIEKHMSCRKHIRNSKIPQLRVQKKFNFRGLLCPVFTPFTGREKDINYGVIPHYANYLASRGITGILINDSFGEGMSLTIAERMKLTEEWAKACEKTKQHLMVHVGGAPFKDVQELIRHAERKRVDSIVVLPDLYSKPKDHFDLMRYIKIVSDTANTLPLLYYHNPSYTGVDINITKFLSDILGEIDSFIGVIFNDNNLKDATSALQLNEDKFIVFMGTDEILLGAFVSGFNSFVSASLNFMPKIVQNILDYTKDGDFTEAQKAQNTLRNVLESVCRHGEKIPSCKVLMNILTPVDVGSVRDPLVPIWQDKINTMKSDLSNLHVKF